MDPAFGSGELSEVRDFDLIFVLDDFGVLIVGFVDSFGSELQRMSDSGELCFELRDNKKSYIMPFDPRKCRIRDDRTVQSPSKNSLDFPCNSDVLNTNRGQFFPVAILEIIGDKESMIVDSFA